MTSKGFKHEKKLKIYVCDYCDLQLSQKAKLERHINEVHKNIRNFSCLECDYIASQKCHIKKHVDSVHLQLRQYRCKICDRAYKDISHLSRHMKIGRHETTTKARRNSYGRECPFCEFKSKRSFNVKKHVENIHMKLKQFQCQECEYGANHNWNLKKHIERHHLPKKAK